MSFLSMFRFRLSTLLVLTTAVAVSCGILFGIRDDLIRGVAILVGSLIYSSILLSLLAYGTSQTRAFAMGAVLPLALLLVTFSVFIAMRLFEAFDFARQLPLELQELGRVIGERGTSFVAACWAASLVCGLVCYAMRWMLLHGRRSDAVQSEGIRQDLRDGRFRGPPPAEASDHAAGSYADHAVRPRH